MAITIRGTVEFDVQMPDDVTRTIKAAVSVDIYSGLAQSWSSPAEPATMEVTGITILAVDEDGAKLDPTDRELGEQFRTQVDNHLHDGWENGEGMDDWIDNSVSIRKR